jgi:hypothetical protein
MKKILSGNWKTPFCICAILAVVILSLTANADPVSAHITVKAVSGHATSCTNGITYQSLQTGDFVGPGAILKTDSASTVDLILPDSGTVLRLMPDSVLQFAKLNQEKAGEQHVSDTALKLIKGSIIGSQRKLAVPSHFEIATEKSVATIVGTEYVVSASGAVTVLDGQVSINYNLPGNGGSVKVSIPQGYSFDPATQTVVPTSSKYLQNIIADINTVQQNAQTFKANGATIVIKPEAFVSPTKGNNGVGNGVDPQPPGNPPVNDGTGTSPGNPGNKGGASN